MREKQSCRGYNLEFKKAAIAKAKQSDNVSQTTRDLGLNIALLHSWVSQELKACNKGLTLENVREEKDMLQRLKRENARLLEEDLILKNATAYFSQHHLS